MFSQITKLKDKMLDFLGYPPSPQQADIFDEILTGNGHLIIEARAGCGKTSTLLRSLQYMRGEVFIGAFNKAIAVEIQEKVAQMSQVMDLPCRVTVQTIHAAGLRAYKRLARNAKIESNKMRLMAEELGAKDTDYLEYENFLVKLVGFAKRAGVGNLIDDENGVWEELISYYGVADELPDNAYDEESDVPEKLIQKLIGKARAMYQLSLQACKDEVDFDDMLLAPINFNAKFDQFDWVLIDELQDCSPIRQEIAVRMLKPKTGRLIGVGDPAQCQPAGTEIWQCSKKGSRFSPPEYKSTLVEDLKPGDTVLSFNLSDSAFYQQREVLGVASRRYTGDLIVADLGNGSVSKYTPEHICVASFRTLENKFVTYLMRRDGKYRVGMCPMFYDGGNITGITSRMNAEGADASWVLGVYDTSSEARKDESVISANFGLPQLMFCPKNNSAWVESDFREVWERILPNKDKAIACLTAFGRLLEFPFVSTNNRNLLPRQRKSSYTRKTTGVQLNAIRRTSLVRACNLLDGCLMIGYTGNIHPTYQESRFVATITREHYDGYVYSLSVAGEQLYVADGIVTHNCIFGFTGCSHDEMEQLTKRMGARVLPLSVTYRCPKQVVCIANTWVPDIQAHESAPDGVVRRIELEPSACQHCNGRGTVESDKVTDGESVCPKCQGTCKSGPGFWDEAHTLGPESVIICRNNKPIVELGYQLLRKNIPCKIEGRDFAGSLIKLCQRWKTRELNKLEERLLTYRQHEADKWRKKKNEERAAGVEDKVDTLLALLDAVRSSGKTKVSDLIDKINMMFADTEPGRQPRVLTLSSVHKAKGKEWDKVYILGRNRYMPSKWARQPHEIQAESNIAYVAVTRAKRELVDIDVSMERKRRV